MELGRSCRVGFLGVAEQSIRITAEQIDDPELSGRAWRGPIRPAPHNAGEPRFPPGRQFCPRGDSWLRRPVRLRWMFRPRF